MDGSHEMAWALCTGAGVDISEFACFAGARGFADRSESRMGRHSRHIPAAQVS